MVKAVWGAEESLRAAGDLPVEVGWVGRERLE